VEAIKEPFLCYKYKIPERHEQNAREAKVEWASHSIQASSGMLYYAADETLLLLLLVGEISDIMHKKNALGCSGARVCV
jgi:hypothetical protein